MRSEAHFLFCLLPQYRYEQLEAGKRGPGGSGGEASEAIAPCRRKLAFVCLHSAWFQGVRMRHSADGGGRREGGADHRGGESTVRE